MVVEIGVGFTGWSRKFDLGVLLRCRDTDVKLLDPLILYPYSVHVRPQLGSLW